MKNIIYTNSREFFEVYEKDDKIFTKSIFSIYPYADKMFVADEDMTITVSNNDTTYHVKKGDVVLSLGMNGKKFISVLHDEFIKQLILDEQKETQRRIAEKSKIGSKPDCESDCMCDCKCESC